MGFIKSILGTLYFGYYGTIAYVTNYEKHIMWRHKCQEVWNAC